MKPQVVLSLFDGMSCGQIALNRLGIPIKTYYASEVDPYPIKVTQANYPDTIQLGDVRDISLESLPERPDILLAGAPCQGFSFAGKQLNFEDPRSKLFFDFVRVLKILKPKYFLLENVRMKKESQDIISKYLGVEPRVFNSNKASAQNRHRLYWFNWEVDELEDKGIVLADILEDGVTDREKSHCIDANYFKGGNLKSYFQKHRRQLVFTNTCIQEGEADIKETYRKLSCLEVERLQTVPDNYTAHVSNSRRYHMLGNGWTVDVICHILKNMQIIEEGGTVAERKGQIGFEF